MSQLFWKDTGRQRSCFGHGVETVLALGREGPGMRTLDISKVNKERCNWQRIDTCAWTYDLHFCWDFPTGPGGPYPFFSWKVPDTLWQWPGKAGSCCHSTAAPQHLR